jgi:hypothetical protein
MTGYYKFYDRKIKFSGQKETADVVALRGSETFIYYFFFFFAVLEMSSCHADHYNLVPLSGYAVFSIQ